MRLARTESNVSQHDPHEATNASGCNIMKSARLHSHGNSVVFISPESMHVNRQIERCEDERMSGHLYITHNALAPCRRL